MTGAFDIHFDDLPAEIAVFPLVRVILLPRAQLPLNIFEPRYLAMVADAMKTNRLIGMIQPDGAGGLLPVGGAGRIVSFSETDDGRYLITLKGVSRFRVTREIDQSSGGYRRVAADWSPYKGDATEDLQTDVCRDTLVQKLHSYFSRMNISCEQWGQMKTIPCEQLISTLSMVCPFPAEDKQALLECESLAARAQLLQALVDVAIGTQPDAREGATCH